jgi:hypothetical protein
LNKHLRKHHSGVNNKQHIEAPIEEDKEEEDHNMLVIDFNESS